MKKKKILTVGLFVSFLFAGFASCQQSKACPTEDKIKTGIKELIPREFKVESVQTLKDIPGLCEVVIKVGAQPLVFYTDKEMKYVLDWQSHKPCGQEEHYQRKTAGVYEG
jgi:thiol:disulfide interchange protein DsbC